MTVAGSMPPGLVLKSAEHRPKELGRDGVQVDPWVPVVVVFGGFTVARAAATRVRLASCVLHFNICRECPLFHQKPLALCRHLYVFSHWEMLRNNLLGAPLSWCPP